MLLAFVAAPEPQTLPSSKSTKGNAYLNPRKRVTPFMFNFFLRFASFLRYFKICHCPSDFFCVHLFFFNQNICSAHAQPLTEQRLWTTMKVRLILIWYIPYRPAFYLRDFSLACSNLLFPMESPGFARANLHFTLGGVSLTFWTLTFIDFLEKFYEISRF